MKSGVMALDVCVRSSVPYDMKALGPDSVCVGTESVMVLGLDILATDPQITYYKLHVGIYVFDTDGGGGINK
jgi:hypothetical protein